MEVPDAPVDKTWWRLFITRTDGALRRGPDGWIFTPARLTVPELDAALRGQVSLGTYAVSETGLSRWLCLDADSVEGFARLWQLAQELDPAHTVFETSHRGGHLWWLCPPTRWEVAQAVGRSLVGNRADIEVYPKGAGRTGVRLPGIRHPTTGAIYPILDPASGEQRTLASLQRLEAAPMPALPTPLPPARPVVVHPSSDAFAELRATVEELTSVRVYAPDRAVGRCPFHDDRHPSLSLVGGFWRCWAGCGEGGVNAFRAIARSKGLEVSNHALSTTE